MKSTENKRVTAKVDENFVILIIGMSVNKWWKVHVWLGIVRAMFRMIREQEEQKPIGLLASEHRLIGNPTLFVQYWRSYEALEAYASDASKKHLPAWAKYNKKVQGNGCVGIYHEIYKVEPDQFENVYVNMPAFGMGKFANLVPAEGRMKTSRGRMTASIKR